MKLAFSVNKEEFIKILSHATGIIENKNVNKILGCVLIESLDNTTLKITATDSAIGYFGTCKINLKSPGAIATNGFTLADVIKTLNNGNVELEFDENTNLLEVSSGNANFKLATVQAKEYPIIDINSNEHNSVIEIKNSHLQNLLDAVKFSISNEKSRYNLNGIYLENLQDLASNINAVSTDGHRLSIASFHAEKIENFQGVIIPRKTAFELRKMLDDVNPDQLIKINFSSRKIKFDLGNFIIISKLVDATYPNYKNLLPKSEKIKVTISRSNLYHAVERVSAITSEKFRGVKLSFTNEDMTISAAADSTGSSKENIHCNNNMEKGDVFTVGANFRYLAEALDAMKNFEFVEISLIDSTSPILLKPQNSSSQSYIIMPMIVQ